MNLSVLKFSIVIVMLTVLMSSCASDGTNKGDVAIASNDLTSKAAVMAEDIVEKVTLDEKKSDKLLEIFVSPEEIDKKEAAEEKKEKAIESIERKIEEKKKEKKETRVETPAPIPKPKPTPQPKSAPVAIAETYEEPKLGKTKISFTNLEHDYGMIMQGDKVDHKFNFRNTGNVDLVISDVSASCGCTKPSYPFIPIAPGEKGYIGVTFDSKGKLGRQQPTVTVVSNAGTSKLKLTGFVDAERAGSNKKTSTTPIDIIDDDQAKKLKKEAIDSVNGEGGR